ncbi:hypothetical protein ANO14919_078360 [Xylariales sp. No.14919]|nr:hypothetical protein ANO14919_078360 [Xylariales sp. No.14919]
MAQNATLQSSGDINDGKRCLVTSRRMLKLAQYIALFLCHSATWSQLSEYQTLGNDARLEVLNSDQIYAPSSRDFNVNALNRSSTLLKKSMITHTLTAASRGLTGLGAWANHGQPEFLTPSPHHDETTAQPPFGFPPSVQGPTVWPGEDGRSFDPHTLELGPTDVAEIEQALKYFLGLGLDGSEVSRDNFPLPVLCSRLRDCAVNIHRGSGLCIVRGLMPQSYSAEDDTIIFLGLASYIGSQRGVQSSKGAMLTHVYESQSWAVPRERRHGIHTNNSLPFHNDMGCEILAIQIRNCAAQGGGTYVASAAAVYNAMMKANPWALHILAKHNWPVRV